MASWWNEASPAARRALVAGSLGWALDSFDLMLFSLVLNSLILHFGMEKGTAGLLGSITLVAGAAGGLLFGVIADRFGRTRALIGSVLLYSIFTAACGLAESFTHLAIFRIFLGLGMGGEWASGAALVSETWTDKHRGKALGIMQSSWAIGGAAATLVTAFVLPRWGWRAVFFVGVLPALLTLWVRRNVQEPAIWIESRGTGRARQTVSGTTLPVSPPASLSPPASRLSPSFSDMFRGRLLGVTIAITLMNACTLFAWWGFNQWVPAYLRLPAALGGLGLSDRTMSTFVFVMQIGMWFGYVTFGFVSDYAGRRKMYVGYLLTAAALIALYALTTNRTLLLVLGPAVAFFATGYFSGFGAITAEIYPTRIRASAQGFTYNLGRIASAAAPFTVGALADSRGFGVAFSTTAMAFIVAALLWIWIPETRGKGLD
jgi:MFS family permease